MVLNRKLSFFTLFLILGLPNLTIGQHNIGMPNIINYSKNAYQAGLQNWDIAQDSSGRMYFANNGGLLIFDGINWELVQVANKTIVRSLLIDGERIYVGSQGDFGYFLPTHNGQLLYHSLKHLMPKGKQSFSDVWDIIKTDEQIIFRTSDRIFSLKDSIEVLDTGTNYSFLGQHENSIYSQHVGKALYKIQGSELNLVFNQSPFNNYNITGIVGLGNGLLVSTNKNGLFLLSENTITPWLLNDFGFIKKNRVNDMIRIDKDRIAIATLSAGLFVINNNGKVLHHFDVEKGLQSNDVLKIFKDGVGNLWLGLGNGIGFIEISSAFSTIRPDNDMGGTGFSVKIHEDKIYFGESNGLYVADWKAYYHPLENQVFQLVKNSRGQVWNVDIHNNELLMGHHEGTFRIENEAAIQLSDLPGTWTFTALNDQNDLLLSGNYYGLNLYNYENNQWQFQSPVSNMPHESCRIITQDEDGYIWVAHPYRGVYRIRLNVQNHKVETIKLYNSAHGFPSDLYIHLFKIGDGLVFTGEKGVYVYNQEQDNFELSPEWSKLISPESRVHYLKEDKDGNIWFVIDYEVGVFRVKDLGVEKQLERHDIPQLTGRLVGGFEHIYPYDEENVFFPLENGFMHFNPKKYGQHDTLFHVHLSEVKLADSLVVFGGWKFKNWQKPRFKHNQNAFSFKYASSYYNDLTGVTFQYQLKGLDKSWSPWTKKNVKEYSALPFGEYNFQVRGKNCYGQITAIKSFPFEILPPWYATLSAKIIYAILGLGIFLGLVFIPRRKFEKEKAILKEEQEKTLKETTQEYQKIVAKNEAEISALQREKLKAEIQFKNQELATTTMHLVQRGELINKLLENLESMMTETKEPKFKKSIRSSINLLNQNANLDDEWEKFAHHFDEVNSNFLKRLVEAYPQLTPKDQRMCTYLKMNLSSKEIMLLMNISVRGIESSRYRLRKKLGLGSEVNLTEFLMKF